MSRFFTESEPVERRREVRFGMHLEARLWRVKRPMACVHGTTENVSRSGIAIRLEDGAERFLKGERVAFEVCVSEDKAKGAEVLLTGVGSILRLDRPGSGARVLAAKILRARMVRRAEPAGGVPFDLWAGAYDPVHPQGRQRDQSI